MQDGIRRGSVRGRQLSNNNAPFRAARRALTLGVAIAVVSSAVVTAASRSEHAADLASPTVGELSSGATALMPAVRNPVFTPGPPPLDPPTGGSGDDAFVSAVMAEPDAAAHSTDAGKASEHAALLQLVPRSSASHVAVRDGAWSNPSTWYRGAVPGAGARVLIPRNIGVTYDLTTDVALFTTRVDGLLEFATNRNTRIVIDTLVVSPSGRLEIGTAANPVGPTVSAEIVIAANGDIDTSWDPTLVSRGLVSHGDVEIRGAEKQTFVKVAQTPLTGHQSLTLAEAPSGWRVGDTIVLTGTKQLGWYWDNSIRQVRYHESQDEVRTISAINGATITLDSPLVFDHSTPRADLAAYVSNTSRSITVSSAGGPTLPVHQRGHTMFMHSDDVDVRYAAFDYLGRTDKSRSAADLDAFAVVTPTSNIKGRYSVHFHKTGTEHQDDPAIIIGNSVTNSPGWGYTHHSSHANFTDNVAFDVFGAGFAAEDGDETGVWLRNITIKSQGIGWGDWTVKEAADVARHDNGRTGDGFFFAGRLVEAAENVAANTTNGFVWFHRGERTPPTTTNLQHPETGYGRVQISADDPSIEGFRNNEAFATHSGIIVIKANPAQGHDGRTVFDGFLNWETVEGVNLSYTAHYTLKNLDLIGLTQLEPFQRRRAAFHVGTNASDMVVNGFVAQRFETGLEFGGNTTTFPSVGARGHVVIDAQLSDVAITMNEFIPGSVRMMNSSELGSVATTFNYTGATSVTLGEWLYLDGTKTDSIGTTDRHIERDRHGLDPWQNIAQLLVDQGYWTLPDGRKVLLLDDIVSDRATGAATKLVHVIEINATDNQLRNASVFRQIGAAKSNGPTTIGGPAPSANADAALSPSFSDTVIDVLANDSDPDGGTVRLSGLNDPAHGDVVRRDDGTVLYRSNFGFVGSDSFDYWVTDDEGNVTRGSVVVNVTAPAAAASVQSAKGLTAVASNAEATTSFGCSPATVLIP